MTASGKQVFPDNSPANYVPTAGPGYEAASVSGHLTGVDAALAGALQTFPLATANTSSVVGAGNNTFLSLFYSARSIRLNSASCWVDQTSGGTISLGVYTVSGTTATLVGSTAPAAPSPTGLFTRALTAPVDVAAGALYGLAIGQGNANGSRYKSFGPGSTIGSPQIGVLAPGVVLPVNVNLAAGAQTIRYWLAAST